MTTASFNAHAAPAAGDGLAESVSPATPRLGAAHSVLSGAGPVGVSLLYRRMLRVSHARDGGQHRRALSHLGAPGSKLREQALVRALV